MMKQREVAHVRKLACRYLSPKDLACKFEMASRFTKELLDILWFHLWMVELLEGAELRARRANDDPVWVVSL